MSIADQSETRNHEHEISLDDLMQRRDFIRRHIGPRDSDLPTMLETVGATSLDDLIESTIPADLLLSNDPAFDPACLLYTSPSPRDRTRSRMPSSA